LSPLNARLESVSPRNVTPLMTHCVSPTRRRRRRTFTELQILNQLARFPINFPIRILISAIPPALRDQQPRLGHLRSWSTPGTPPLVFQI
jgi:hypothetical protein